MRILHSKPCARLSRRPRYSSPSGFLCFGFLRNCFGMMGLLARTCPTRSRASLRTSLSRSNFFFGAIRLKFLARFGLFGVESEFAARVLHNDAARAQRPAFG